ncbi:peptidyl-prolyl cis-trans isomerase [Fragilaria crotonensis]|nr:peptidyl-prolyl cis-trans isomerase [Fragilaria crotonensis]
MVVVCDPQFIYENYGGLLSSCPFLLTTSLCHATDNSNADEHSSPHQEQEHHEKGRIARKPLLDPVPMLPRVTQKVYLDIQFPSDEHASGEGDVDTYTGRIVLGLFGTHAPQMVENFKALCECTRTDPSTTESDATANNPHHLCYKGSAFHRVIPNFMIQGGDITHHDGTGGATIYGHDIVDESLSILLNRKYLLASANKGYRDSNTSQFFITTVKTQWLNGKHVVFGVVVDGEDVVKRIEALGTNGGKPKRKITIMDSGVLELTTKEQNERIPVALPEPFVLRKTEKES